MKKLPPPWKVCFPAPCGGEKLFDPQTSRRNGLDVRGKLHLKKYMLFFFFVPARPADACRWIFLRFFFAWKSGGKFGRKRILLTYTTKTWPIGGNFRALLGRNFVTQKLRRANFVLQTCHPNFPGSTRAYSVLLEGWQLHDISSTATRSAPCTDHTCMFGLDWRLSLLHGPQPLFIQPKRQVFQKHYHRGQNYYKKNSLKQLFCNICVVLF